MTRRREFPNRVKLARWDHAGGRCEDCGKKLFTGDIEYDHDLPDYVGGEPTFENCRVRCKACHGLKTSDTDQPRIGKTRRNRKQAAGIKRKSRSMPGSKTSGWRKPMNRPAERRQQ